MKKTALLTTTLSLFLFSLQTIYAQSTGENKTEKYRIKMVQKENGKETVIDRTFATREEMAEFIRNNHPDLPHTEPTAPEPPATPRAPLPIAAPNHDCKKVAKKQCEKIVIVENEEHRKGNKTKVRILPDDLAASEREIIEKEIETADGEEVKIIIIKKGGR